MTKNDIYEALQNSPLPLLSNEASAYKPSAYATAQLKLIEAYAKESMSRSTPALKYSDFKRYWQDGDREEYQKPYYLRRGRLLCYALMTWQKKGEREYLCALEDIIWEICSESFWCLPAHFAGLGGVALPFSEYATNIDLFAAETALGLAEAIELCGQYLSQDIISLIDANLSRRIFTPFLDGAKALRFETMDNNWASVCAGAVGAAFIYRVQDTATLCSALHRVDSSMQLYLSSFGDDGVCTEGVDYWSYGYGFYVTYADLLYKRTGGAIDMFANDKSEAIARSFAAFYMGGKATVSFSDGSEASSYRAGLISYLAKRYKGLEVPPQECIAPVLDDSCNRFCLGVRDILWYDETVLATNPREYAYFADAKWYTLRFGSLSLAAKGGHNGESHNHNDCGSFIVAKDGVQLICDLGAGLYTAEYFGDGRYDIFVNRSISHNVAIIGKYEQGAGKAFASKDDKASQSGFSTELSACYKGGNAHSYLRTLHAQNACITLTDTFALAEPCEITEVFVSRAPIILQQNTAYFARDGKELALSFALGTPTLDQVIYQGHKGEDIIAYRLLITIPASENISFKAEIK